MRKEAEKESTKLSEEPSNVFTLLKFMKRGGKDIEGERCMRRKNLNLGFSKKDWKIIWKNHTKKMMNNEKDRDSMTEASMVEGSIEKVTREETAIAIKAMKPERLLNHLKNARR